MTDNGPSEEEVEDLAGEVARDSVELGDYGPVAEVDGECVECGAEAAWQSPEGRYYCQEHAKDHFKERHG